MTIEEAENYLNEAASVSELESFMVFGGEPMLYPKRAIAAFRKARQLRIQKIAMLTNGIWGKNKENAEKLAKKLKAAGLDILRISVDAFHLQYIPLEYPKNAALASVEADIEEVSWNVAVLESIDATNEYDRSTKQILEKLEPTGIPAHIHKVAPVGRATRELHRYFQHVSVDGPCTGDPILENALKDPTSITIEPSGEAEICWGLAIGNARKQPLSQILNEYDWQRNPIITTLVEEGPMKLVKTVEKDSYRFRKSQYISRCHLCIEVRKTLNPP
jgi:hypothetical protein